MTQRTAVPGPARQPAERGDGAAAHSRPAAHIVAEFASDTERGLAAAEAATRLELYGPNELRERPRPGVLQRLVAQLSSFLVLLLIVAAVISLLLGEVVDAAAILAIVVLNAVLGLVQEMRAEHALEALKRMAAPVARVVRDGHQGAVPTRDLVPGDVVLLEAGNYVPADVRLLETARLAVDEAPLTGESVPVTKDASQVLAADAAVADRRNAAFMGTMVTYGRGKGLVVATGMRTQVGEIAELLQTYEEEPTPLQRKLDQLGRWLGQACLVVCALVFGLGVLRDTRLLLVAERGVGAYLSTYQQHLVDLFMTAVSLAIAAVPEGLPAVVTICLALGVQRMIRRHALLRRLPAVETLGCATVICSDKTGTLTQNAMTVQRGWTPHGELHIGGGGYVPVGDIRRGDAALDVARDAAAALLLAGGAACNDARLERDEADQERWRIAGDPTEAALLVAAAKAGIWSDALTQALPRIGETPFDSARKRMTTIHRLRRDEPEPDVAGQDVGSGGPLAAVMHALQPAPVAAFAKGAPDVLLGLCDAVLVDGRAVILDDARRAAIEEAQRAMAHRALRVLAVAYRALEADEVPADGTADSVEAHLTFVGLLGMIDPARVEVKDAVTVARDAGLKTVMITGDHRDTAMAVAGEVGILTSDAGSGAVLSGADLDAIDDEALAARVHEVDAFVRVSPHHKVKIVEALKTRGHVVAMTGDGVNDAPALKRANIGVAMGITGTDVARDAADMVLTDDNYASIVAAIEEGRVIYGNIRKFVYYLVACNVGEILIIFLAMLIGLPLPLRAIQLLWLNLATDGAPALALGMEKGDADVMRRPPRRPDEPVVDREMVVGIGVQAAADTAAVLGAFVWALGRFSGDLAAAQTVAFATLTCSELVRAYTARSQRQSVFEIGLFSNRWMVAATGASLLLLLATIYVPSLQPAFGTVPLGATDWLAMLPAMLAASAAAELTKLFWRRRDEARRLSQPARRAE